MALACSIGGQAGAFELVFVNASPQIYSGPHDIVISPNKKSLFVADSNNDRIAILDPNSLKFISSFGEGIISSPHDVVFDTEGRLLVADTDNSRVVIFQVNGVKASMVGELRGEFRRPEGVDVHINGNIYVTGASSNNIEVFQKTLSINKANGLTDE